jgi:hypothetical protein
VAPESATFAPTGRTTHLLIVLAMATIGCGSTAAGQGVGGDGGTPEDAGLPEASRDGGPPRDAGLPEASRDDAGGVLVRDVGLVLGMMAFNEPMNDGFVHDLVPSWSSDGLTFSGSGHLTGSVTLTAAGPTPAADQWRDVLFWNVNGEFPFGQDSQFLPLSLIVGVIASTSTASTATFSVDGALDLSGQGAGGGTAHALAFALTWVRVYRSGADLQYQVLPGWRDAGDGSTLSWDRSTGPVSGPLGYYAPLADSPALGSDFDYPSWVRAHVTWQ